MKINSPWMVVVGATAAGAAAFVASFLVGLRIPPEGDSRLESLVAAFLSLGGTVWGVAVAISAVLLTLKLQRQSEQQYRLAQFQAGVLREAYDWISRVQKGFGEVISSKEELFGSVSSRWGEKLTQANSRAQYFYDNEQNLQEVDRIARLIKNEEVKKALTQADGALRNWNEQVAGDHLSRSVDLNSSEEIEWEVYGEICRSRDLIAETYSNAVHSAYRGP